MNRKQFLLTLLLAVISAFLGGALGVWLLMPQSVLAQDGPQKQTIEAERFVLKDDQGRMRADLSMILPGPALKIYDAEGEMQTFVGEGVVAVYRDGVLGEGYVFIAGGDTPKITITDGKGSQAALGTGWATFRDGDGSQASLESSGATFTGDSPKITIIDEQGFQAVLGSTGTVETRTGKTNQTSAASLILFGKDGTAIWSAP